MSEKVTDADYAMAESAWAAASDESPHGLAVHELSQHFAAHRIAAVERCVAMFKQLLVDAASGQEYEAAGCDVEGDDDSADTYRHAQGEIEQIIKRLDELAKEE